MVVVGVDPVVSEHVLGGNHVVLLELELALDIRDLDDAIEVVVLDHVPQLDAVAILGHVVAAQAPAAHGLEHVAVARAVVDGVQQGTELVIVVVAVAQHALVDGNPGAQSLVLDGEVGVFHVGQRVAQVDVAGAAAATVCVKIVIVIRDAAGIRAVPVVALIFGRRALNLGAILQCANLGRILGIDFVLASVDLSQTVEALIVGIRILDAGIQHVVGSAAHFGVAHLGFSGKSTSGCEQ